MLPNLGIELEDWLRIVPPWLSLVVSLAALTASIGAWRRSAPPLFAEVWAVCDGRGEAGVTIECGARNLASHVVRIEHIVTSQGQLVITQRADESTYPPTPSPALHDKTYPVRTDLKPSETLSLRIGLKLASPFPEVCKIKVRMSAMRDASKTKDIVIPITIPADNAEMR